MSKPMIQQCRQIEDSVEERFFPLFYQAAVGFAKVGLDCRWLRVNRKLCEITGYSEAELLGMTFCDITYPADLARDLDNMHKVLGRELDINLMEKRYIRKDGAVVWVNLTATLVRDDAQNPLYFIAIIEDITGRKQAEQALKESEERMRLVLEGVNDGIWDWDLRTGSLFWNPRHYEMLGLSPETFTPRFETVQDLFHPDDRKQASATLEAFLDRMQGSDLYEGRYRLRHAQGHYVDVLFRGRVFRDGAGNPVRMAGSTTDVTRQQAMQDALSFQSHLTRTITDNATAALFMMDTQGVCTYLNPSAERMLGYTLAELQYKPLHDWIHYRHEDGTPFPMEECPIHKALQEQNQIHGYRDVLVRKDGTFVPVLCSARPIYENGVPKGTVVEVRDITEEERTRRQLERRHQQQAMVAELGLDAFSAMPLPELVDKAVRLVAQTLDVELCKVMQLLPGTPDLLLVAGVGWRDGLVGHARFSAGLDSQSGYALISQKPVVVEDLRKEDRFHPPSLLVEHGVVSGVTVVIQAQNKPWGAMGAHTTSYRQFSRNDINFCQAVANVLAMAIERRESENRLKQAKEEAESANRKKSQFLANMSHELRTPLNAVIGYSEMLKSGMAGPLTQKQLRYADNVVVSGKHLLDMVNDILDLSKAEAGQIDIDCEWIKLEPFLFEVLSIVKEQADRHQVQLAMDIAPDVTGVWADSQRLRQVYFNLLSNAVKFNRRGGTAIVRVFRSPDGQWLVSQVEDTGIGIPADKMDGLFSEFYQVDASYSRQYEGTGLGLALTRRLVELHGGSIEVSSQEGVGSVFSFRIPLR